MFFDYFVCMSLLRQVESLLDDADLSVELSREKFEALNDELFTRRGALVCTHVDNRRESY